MVKAATDAPVRASISTPVRWCTDTWHVMTISPLRLSSISIAHLSMGRGWQKGMRSCVRLAAMTPEMMAVSNTGPFFVRWPLLRSAAATFGGKRTRASAVAMRCVTLFAPTSTMVGRLRSSRCVRPVVVLISLARRVATRVAFGFLTSPANVEHFDLAMIARCLPDLGTFPAVSVGASQPYVANRLQKFVVGGAAAQRVSQARPFGRKQASVDHAVGG